MKNLSWGGPGACGGPKSWTSDRIYSENRRETKKGEHSVLFVSSFLLRKAEAPYQKNEHSVLFVIFILLRKVEAQHPQKRREFRLVSETYLVPKSRGRYFKKDQHFVLFPKHFR